MILIKSLIVGLGGAIGSIIRFLIGLIPLNETTSFPINTFIVNVIGAIAIGFIVFYASENFDENWLLFLKVGICGGFTTFSTFALETADLMKAGNTMVALLYVVLSVIVAVGVIFAVEYLTLK